MDYQIWLSERVDVVNGGVDANVPACCVFVWIPHESRFPQIDVYSVADGAELAYRRPEFIKTLCVNFPRTNEAQSFTIALGQLFDGRNALDIHSWTEMMEGR